LQLASATLVSQMIYAIMKLQMIFPTCMSQIPIIIEVNCDTLSYANFLNVFVPILFYKNNF
jgi:hypothetical protein